MGIDTMGFLNLPRGFHPGRFIPGGFITGTFILGVFIPGALIPHGIGLILATTCTFPAFWMNRPKIELSKDQSPMGLMTLE